MITRQHTQEALCRAAVLAIAGAAGVNILFTREFDYGVDCTVRPTRVDRRGKVRIAENGVALDLQLKSTVRWRLEGDGIHHSLENKTWNDMIRRPPTAIPLCVVAMCMPREDESWLRCQESELSIGGCCYFFTGEGEPRMPETGRQQIVIPRSNVLNAASLRKLVRHAGLRLGVADVA